jgi:hypothetical protein
MLDHPRIPSRNNGMPDCRLPVIRQTDSTLRTMGRSFDIQIPRNRALSSEEQTFGPPFLDQGQFAQTPMKGLPTA